jgi:RND family efflux transporter MFP subunit
MLDTAPHTTTHLSPPPQPKRAKPGGGLKLAGLIALIVAAIIVVLGLMSRLKSEHDLKTWTADQAIPTVTLAKVVGGSASTLVLPGSVQPFSSASIHARVPGYLKKWYVDIGANVKEGQLLAEIDTPDLDQQVTQARADLVTAQANQKLSESTSKRWTDLLASDAVSHQEADEKAGDLAARQSLSNAAKANLDRLLALESFKRITAPFAGVVITRSTDVGALIGLDTALFTVADQHRMRIYVRVPQTSSSLIHAGQTAELTAPEYPGQVFNAVVASDARAVDAQTGGLLTELQIDNASGMLKAGEYVQVSFNLPAVKGQGIVVPSTALLYRDNGPAVVLLSPDNTVTVHPVKIAQDLGANIEIASGLSPQDKVADNPPENIATGDKVQIASPNAQPKAANAKG